MIANFGVLYFDPYSKQDSDQSRACDGRFEVFQDVPKVPVEE